MIIKEFIEIISGGKTGGYYLAGLFFSVLAIYLSVYINSKTRNPDSPNTPKKFSWKFLVWNTGRRVVAGLVVMYILLRVLDLHPETSILPFLGVGFGVAFGLDKIIQTLMTETNILDWLQPDKLKFMQKISEKEKVNGSPDVTPGKN